MPIIIVIEVPNSIQKYAPLLKRFFDGMIKKLDKNSHKETPTKETIERIIDLLFEEIIEFKRQIHEDKYNENSLIELMDTANFAFLAYVALIIEMTQNGK